MRAQGSLPRPHGRTRRHTHTLPPWTHTHSHHGDTHTHTPILKPTNPGAVETHTRAHKHTHTHILFLSFSHSSTLEPTNSGDTYTHTHTHTPTPTLEPTNPGAALAWRPLGPRLLPGLCVRGISPKRSAARSGPAPVDRLTPLSLARLLTLSWNTASLRLPKREGPLGLRSLSSLCMRRMSPKSCAVRFQRRQRAWGGIVRQGKGALPRFKDTGSCGRRY